MTIQAIQREACIIIDEQLWWWKDQGLTPLEVWVSLGGSPERDIVTWDNIRWRIGPDAERIAARQVKYRKAA